MAIVTRDAQNDGFDVTIPVGNFNAASCAFTYCEWSWLDSTGTKASGNQRLLVDSTAAGQLCLGGWSPSFAGDWMVSVPCATTNGRCDVKAANIKFNQWQCKIATFDNSLAAAPKVYLGDMSTALAQTTYDFTQAPAGTPNVSAGTGFSFKLSELNTFNPTGIKGRVGVVALFSRVLTMAEMQEWMRAPKAFSGCLVFVEPCSLTQIVDLSGRNAATVTITGTSTLGDHVVLGRKRGRANLLDTVFPAGGGGGATTFRRGMGSTSREGSRRLWAA